MLDPVFWESGEKGADRVLAVRIRVIVRQITREVHVHDVQPIRTRCA
jgi:hypothetical protein